MDNRLKSIKKIVLKDMMNDMNRTHGEMKAIINNPTIQPKGFRNEWRGKLRPCNESAHSIIGIDDSYFDDSLFTVLELKELNELLDEIEFE